MRSTAVLWVSGGKLLRGSALSRNYVQFGYIYPSAKPKAAESPAPQKYKRGWHPMGSPHNPNDEDAEEVVGVQHCTEEMC